MFQVVKNIALTEALMFEKIGTGMIVFFYLLLLFPGGTITMALACKARDLDGWDWVLSVIIPAYGLISAIMC